MSSACECYVMNALFTILLLFDNLVLSSLCGGESLPVDEVLQCEIRQIQFSKSSLVLCNTVLIQILDKSNGR